MLVQLIGLLTGGRPAPPRPPVCAAGDASANTTTGPPFLERTVQRVPLGVGGDRFHVAYSVRTGLDCDPTTIGNNVTIAVFELADGRALVFGSGYGDRTQAEGCGMAFHDAATDAALVDDILRGCLRLGSAQLVFVAPHGHVDHVNPEVVHALEALGHTFDELWVHVGDEADVRAIPAEPEAWEPDELARIFPFGSLDSRCETSPTDPNTKSFTTTVGTVFFSHREGHTPGAVDLVLQHATGDYVLRGSAPPGAAGATECDTPLHTGAVQTWNPHGNVVLQ